MSQQDVKNTAIVVGSGPAGMQSALLLAGRGHRVVLVESAPALGGLFPLLDNQFPTQSCGVCFMACDTPTYCPFLQCSLGENIEVITSAAVKGAVRGEGGWTVDLSIAPTSVDNEKCTDCGACEAVCPVEARREFGDGLETRKAIYRHYPKAVAKGYVIDRHNCTRCGKCVEACKSGAIDLDATGRETSVSGAAVILASGAGLVDTAVKGEFGSGRYENVLSAVKFERMLAAGSPSLGVPVCPKDGKKPESIAFVQCVGSRDPAGGRPHCSSVCCMFTLKQALFAKERLPEAKITVYYMDLRAFGKDYDRYIEKASEAGIEFVRAMPSVLRQSPVDGSLEIAVSKDGSLESRKHSMAVLAGGFAHGEASKGLCVSFGLDITTNGIACGEFTPCESGSDGLFVCGNLAGAKDIPEAALEGANAAGLAATLLSSPPSVDFADGPAPADWRDEAPRTGVVLCACDGYNSDRADFATLREQISALRGVDFVETVSHACSKAGMGEVREIFAKREPNRLLLASCSERIVFDLYRHMFKALGAHEEVVCFADLRGAVMSGDSKAPLASVAAAARAAEIKGFAQTSSERIDRSVLVVGGGVSGMGAALRLAALGHPVHLIERENSLGGTAGSSSYTIGGGNPRKLAASLAAKVSENPAITVYTGAKILQVKGRIGAFKTVISAGGSALEVSHGAVLLATGAAENRPKIHGLGENPRVITQKQAEGLLAEDDFAGKKVVMIQCAGSRSAQAGSLPYCSRVCCTHALKNSLKIKEQNPEAEVTVLYRDLRAYGDYELAYLKARRAGVLFTPFDPENPPRVRAGAESLEVSYGEPSFGGEATVSPDFLILSVGMVPDAEENLRLASLYGAEVDDNGFFVEKNRKTATSDLSAPGVYVAGTAHAPKHIGEALTQAGAAASRASALLSSGILSARANVSTVDGRLCSRCGLCVEACPYGAREIDEEANIAVVDAILCKACGACVTVCPNKAARQYGFTPAEIMAGLDELL